MARQVLTNGFDDDAVEVLRGVGLLDFFGAIVGTQSLRQGGGCISFIRPDVAHRIREASGLAADSVNCTLIGVISCPRAHDIDQERCTDDALDAYEKAEGADPENV